MIFKRKYPQTCPNSKKYANIVQWTSGIWKGYWNGK